MMIPRRDQVSTHHGHSRHFFQIGGINDSILSTFDKLQASLSDQEDSAISYKPVMHHADFLSKKLGDQLRLPLIRDPDDNHTPWPHRKSTPIKCPNTREPQVSTQPKVGLNPLLA
jgi:hypothetical protein